MANQIGKAFTLRTHDQAVAEISAHIKKFWEKRMLTQIYHHIDEGGAGLDPLPKEALQNLSRTERQLTVN
jgi:formate dehydrogenase subunit delta